MRLLNTHITTEIVLVFVLHLEYIYLYLYNYLYVLNWVCYKMYFWNDNRLQTNTIVWTI